MESVALPRNPSVPDVSSDTLLALGFTLVEGGIPVGYKCKLHLNTASIPEGKTGSVPGAVLLLHQGFMFVPQDTPRAMWARGDIEFFNQLGKIARERAFGQVLEALLPQVAGARGLQERAKSISSVSESQVREFGTLLTSPHTVIVPYVDVVQADHDIRPGGFFRSKPRHWMHWAVEKPDGVTKHVVVEFDEADWVAWSELDWRFECEVEELSAVVVNDFLEAEGASDELHQLLFRQDGPQAGLDMASLFLDTRAKLATWEDSPGVPRWPINIPRKDALDLIEARLRRAGFEKAPRAMAALWLSRGMHHGDTRDSPLLEALSEQKFASALVARFGDSWANYLQMQTMYHTRRQIDEAARGGDVASDRA